MHDITITDLYVFSNGKAVCANGCKNSSMGFYTQKYRLSRAANVFQYACM